MTIDFNGTPFSASVAGDRVHDFRLPRDRSRVPAKTQEALHAVQEALTAEAKAKTQAAKQEASDALRAAVEDVYDRAAATSRADRETHREQYTYGAAKLARALEEAQAALQLMADHAQQYANPVGVGFPLDVRSNSPAVMQLRLISETIANLPAVPELA